MLVEFPLTLLLAVGLLTVAALPIVQSTIGLVGGVALLGFGALQLWSAWRYRATAPRPEPRGASRGALVLGITFTAVNPFFLVWWFTIGSKLILDALALAYLTGVLVMYAAHVWMDYAFLTASAHLARRGTQLLGARRYRWVLAGLALILLYFGGSFVWSALTALR